ncbi:MAG: hypothetical protein RLZZ458_1186 [Planctomycetota bacterium]|jgi:hypothetical protein
MIPRQVLNRIVAVIYAEQDLYGCIIGFHGNGQSSVLAPGLANTPAFGRCCVILEELSITDPPSITELRRATNPDSSQSTPPTVISNRSRVGRELLGTGLSCGLAVVAAVGVFGSVAAEVPTGGASTALLVASWAGLGTSGLQCLNGLVRVGAVAADPNGNSLQEWDQNSVYNASTMIVDAIGLASGVASLPVAGRNLWTIIARQRALASRNLTESTLRSMNQTQRAAVISEAFTEASRTTEGRDAIIRALRERGVGPAALQRSTLSVRNAGLAVDVISAERTRRLRAAVLAVLSTPVGGLVSAMPSTIVGNASGSLNTLIVHVVGK